MREEADPTLIVDDLLGPAPPAPPEPTALRELMDWVSNEVFGPAEPATSSAAR